MVEEDRFFVQPFARRGGALIAAELVACDSEEQAFRKGKQMASRVTGAVFYRIETGASGDQWTEIEVLATIGEVPCEAA